MLVRPAPGDQYCNYAGGLQRSIGRGPRVYLRRTVGVEGRPQLPANRCRSIGSQGLAEETLRGGELRSLVPVCAAPS